MASVKDVLDRLYSKAKPEELTGTAKYKMTVGQGLGVADPHVRKLAKEAVCLEENYRLGWWEEEFVKRTAFSLITCLVRHDKKASDKQSNGLLPVIIREAKDECNFVKKAANRAAINAAREMW